MKILLTILTGFLPWQCLAQIGQFADMQSNANVFHRAITNDSSYILLCESRPTKQEDFVLKSGKSLLDSTFVELLNQNKVQLLHVVEAIKGNADNIVVFKERIARSSVDRFVPAFGTKWIVVLERDPTVVERITDKSENPHEILPVLKLSSKPHGIIEVKADQKSQELINDIRAISKVLQEPLAARSLPAVKSELGTNLLAAIQRKP